MGISSKDRKNLWAKSGNKCSICKKELFTKHQDGNEFNIGEECHIISSKTNGPRYKPNIKDYDSFDNLVLLCRNHHKEIDELTDTYTEEVVRYMKLNHENWVKTTLNNSINNKKLLKPDFLTRITSGKELLNILWESHGYRNDYDEVENKEEAEYIGGILQELTDYGDLSSTLEIYDKVKIGLKLNELLIDLEKNGYFLFGRRNIEKVKLGNGITDNLSVATIIIKRKNNEDIIKVNKTHTN